MFKNFMENAYRCADLDDCLLWTLPVGGLLEEYRLGGGERTIAKGYNELWTQYAQKFREMTKELGVFREDDGGKARAKRKPRTGADAGGAAGGAGDGEKKRKKGCRCRCSC